MDTDEVGGLDGVCKRPQDPSGFEHVGFRGTQAGIQAILERIGMAGASLNGMSPEVVVELLIANLQGKEAAAKHDPLMEEVTTLLRKAQTAMLAAKRSDQKRTTLN